MSRITITMFTDELSVFHKACHIAMQAIPEKIETKEEIAVFKIRMEKNSLIVEDLIFKLNEEIQAKVGDFLNLDRNEALNKKVRSIRENPKLKDQKEAQDKQILMLETKYKDVIEGALAYEQWVRDFHKDRTADIENLHSFTLMEMPVGLNGAFLASFKPIITDYPTFA